MPKGSGSCNVERTLFELSKKVTDPEVEFVTAPSPVVESKAMSSGNKPTAIVATTKSVAGSMTATTLLLAAKLPAIAT